MLDESGEQGAAASSTLRQDGEDVRFTDGLATSLKDGDEISIVPAVAWC